MLHRTLARERREEARVQRETRETKRLRGGAQRRDERSQESPRKKGCCPKDSARDVMSYIKNGENGVDLKHAKHTTAHAT